MRLILPLMICAFIMKLKADSAPTINGLPPLKLDKNLRRALLRALEDLEAESAEDRSDPPTAEQLVLKIKAQAEQEQDKDEQTEKPEEDEQEKKNRETILERFKGASITYEHFDSDAEEISEDKLQNSTFIETDKYQADAEVKAEKNQELNQKLDVLLGDQAIIEKSPESVQVEQVETRSVKSIGHSSNRIQNSFKPIAKDINHHNKDNKEILNLSSSNGIASASANSLVPPSPTVSSPTARPAKNISSPVLPTVSSDSKDKTDKSEVNIFQAPLVAAFTVQQDELGVPKSVVPIYKPDGKGQALTLQEQLEFKQQLLEKQLAELQAQQIQQTQFLIRQQQLYQEQQRQKQRQYYLAEQARLKLLEEQKNNQLKLQQASTLQQQQQQLNLQQQQLSLQQLPFQQQSLQPQQLPLQQQLPLPQPLGAFSQNFQALQLPSKSSNVQFQSSLGFQVPSQSFQSNIPEQLRIQQLPFQNDLKQNFNHNQNFNNLQQQTFIRNQERVNVQSFPSVSVDFQPPAVPTSNRFNRQEAVGSVGNFGINENRQQTRNHLVFDLPRPVSPSFVPFNQFSSFRQPVHRPPTPARQIQQLLFQSGVAGDLARTHGAPGNQEDLNIVSKVLALNVGALPTKSHNFNDDFFRA